MNKLLIDPTMQNHTTKFICGLAFILTLWSCTKPDQETKPSCFDFPTTPGNEWIYQVNTPAGAAGLDTMRISGLFNQNGTTYYQHSYLGSVRAEGCNSFKIFRSVIGNNLLLTNNIETDGKEVYTAQFYHAANNCMYTERWIAYKNRMNINGRNCFKFEQLFMDCGGTVTNKNMIYFFENLGITKVEQFSGGSTLVKTLDLIAYKPR